MKSFLLATCLCFFLIQDSNAQDPCGSYLYEQAEFQKYPELKNKIESLHKRSTLIETISSVSGGIIPSASSVIRIPVVVHVMYNSSEQNISYEQILSQLQVLNKSFRFQHPDTAKIPTIFRPLAADCRIEFALATISPEGYITNGIVRKKTKAYSFGGDDKIKFSASDGDNAWPSDRYLNIWTGNLSFGLIGYSSILGGAKEKDGIVVRFDAFGETGKLKAPYTKGKTAIHEIGHWMGLKHIWGDRWCGDDGIEDTPGQPGATRGCPSSFVKACNDLPSGAMYNNYMDLSYDDCTNMFTLGQMEKMRASFHTGSPHNALLFSKGATAIGIPIPDSGPDTSAVDLISIYPNPASNVFILDINTNQRLLGEKLMVYNQLGQPIIQHQIKSNKTIIPIDHLAKGTYFVRVLGNKQILKFLKLEGHQE